MRLLRILGLALLAASSSASPACAEPSRSGEEEHRHTLFGLGGLGTTEQLGHNPWAIYPKSGRTMMDDARSRGVEIWRLYVMWGLYEPEEGKFDTFEDKRIPNGYVRFLKDELDALLARGFKVVIDLQFWDWAPEWLWEIPNARFKNQYGDEFVVKDLSDVLRSGGTDTANWIFNPKIREAMARYQARFFEDFKDYKDKIWAIEVTLGGGGDAFFPYARDWKGNQKNCYWAFDQNAQNQKEPGSLAGPNPVPGWVPGTGDDPRHDKARKFLDWYLESANRAIRWRIEDLRKHFGGRLILYSDLFFKNIDLEPHVNCDLDGSSEVPDNPYLSPAVGAADGRFLKSLASRFPKDEWLVHHSGLDYIDSEEARFARSLVRHIGGENVTVTKEMLNEGQTLKGTLDNLILKVKEYQLEEFLWLYADGLYVENLRDPAYNVSPEYFGEKIREVNGAPPVISGIKARRVDDSRAEVAWSTDSPSDSRLIVCDEERMQKHPRGVYDPAKVKEHKVVLEGLESGRTIYFEAGSDNGENYALTPVQRLE